MDASSIFICTFHSALRERSMIATGEISKDKDTLCTGIFPSAKLSRRMSNSICRGFVTIRSRAKKELPAATLQPMPETPALQNDQRSVTLPSAASRHPGFHATSHRNPSGSAKYPE
jgi:hypothetical protein